MKVPPLNLNPDVNRVGMALPFSPDLLWRYPLSLQQSALAPPSSPLLDVKNQMPAQLAVDPRLWSREDVSTFLRWFEREFELPKIDSTKFCMNGKALCMLTKNDLADRAPGAGDVLHNTLQFLLRDAPQVPPSPLTPHHPLLSPSPLTTSQPWSLVGSDFHTLGHLLQQGGSVTLSPAPSEQSGGSPRHPDPSSSTGTYHHSSSASTGSTHSGSHSDSEDSTRDSSPQRSPLPSQSTQSSFSAQALASLKHLTDYQRAAAAAAAAAAVAVHNYESIPQQQQQQFLQSSHYQSQQQSQQQQTQQQQSQQQQQQQQQQHSSPPFNNDEPVETVTNGRLLWDFLQQLLNDSQQRYQQYIAWKNRETGVFKIVDPPGLARLWGIQKNHLSMNYDKMSRALRYYYRVNILRKVQGERHCYQFLRNPSELKSIKNISLLRGAPVPLPKKWELPPPPATSMEDESHTGLSSISLPRKWEILPPPATPMDDESLTGLSSISLPRKWEITQTPATPMEDEGPTDLSMPNSQQQSRSEMLSSSTHHSQQRQPFEQRTADVTITSAHQQQFEHRTDMETQPENLTIERSDIKTETFSSETFE